MTHHSLGGWSISQQLYDWLRTSLPEGATILELGSGTGTAVLAEHYRMYSVEHNARYLGQHNSTYIHAPIVDSWYDAKILAVQRPRAYDLLLVDGPPGTIGRGGLLKHLEIFDLEKPIVLDDVQRPAERKLLDALAARTGIKPIIHSDSTKSFGVLWRSPPSALIVPSPDRPKRAAVSNASKEQIAVAMTTAPRREPTIDRSLPSLRESGYAGDVHVFSEPKAPTLADARAHVHEHQKTLGCFRNWKYALETLLTSTSSPWLLIVQDDAIWQPGSFNILLDMTRKRAEHRTGFVSLYSSSTNVTSAFVDGWNECRAGWGFWGAVALCVERSAAEELLKCGRFRAHHTNKQVDAVVAASMLDLKRPSFVHVPSLLDHIGLTSTVGHDTGKGKLTPGRRGYRFKG